MTTTITHTKAYDHVMCDNSVSIESRLIWCRIARFTENNKDAFPTQQWLGEEFGLSEQKVYRAIKELKRANLIVAKQRGKKQSNRYECNDWPMTAFENKLEVRKVRKDGEPSEMMEQINSDSSEMMDHSSSDSSNLMVHKGGDSSKMMIIRDNLINRQTTTIIDNLLKEEGNKVEDNQLSPKKDEIENDSLSTVSNNDSELENDKNMTSPLETISTVPIPSTVSRDKYYISPEKEAEYLKNVTTQKMSNQREEYY